MTWWPTPQGPWSGEQKLIPTGQIPGGIYAPYAHPWSTGKDVYFTIRCDSSAGI